MRKVKTALEKDGPSFINVLAPCPRGWQHPSEVTVEIAKLALDTCVWPIYEVDEGYHWKVNYVPKEKVPVVEWLKRQGRFKHLFSPKYESLIEEIQKYVDREWEILLKKTELFA
jgi:pyruvate ferredoxin oxidoreductase beta subunit